MLNHTMIVAFADAIPADELDQFLTDIGESVQDSGVVESYSARRHHAVEGEDEIPAMIATAIVQFTVADEAALRTLFAAPGAGEVIQKWQARHPYRVAWANHKPLS
ncbi:hypothetical protein [Amycolatopsis pithecellobii]|uniref:DUF3240 domain-containing protein n=1 Tax=Amycolatopsis pithecellobii TaxID=664692 RepID=A0A6N7Z3H7_9PSEU|nr:hypothetical protein [Amycolatopsis pithecellobii]MTD56483.1 hypothetical protein [Amycolatopsis pithecellobii]